MPKATDPQATEDYIKRLVDQAPPLSPEQRARIAAILHTANIGAKKEKKP